MSSSARLPDLDSLDLFVDVVRLGSLSRAAAAHRISQPSASLRLRALERRLGVTLLERTPAGSIPTAAGTLVAEWATTVLEAVATLVAGAGALRARAAGKVRIAASYTVAEHLLPGWLARLRLQYPEAVPELEVMNSARVVRQLMAGLADVGFVETPEAPAGLASRVVARDELVLIVAPTHPWARRHEPVTPSLLGRTSLILREPGSGTREALERALEATGVSLAPPLLELGSTAAVKRAALEGTGAVVLSRLAVQPEIEEGRLCLVPTRELDLARSLRAVWVPGRLRPEPVVALVRQASRGSAHPEGVDASPPARPRARRRDAG